LDVLTAAGSLVKPAAIGQSSPMDPMDLMIVHV
jgi:hypothetical protein